MRCQFLWVVLDSQNEPIIWNLNSLDQTVRCPSGRHQTGGQLVDSLMVQAVHPEGLGAHDASQPR